MASYPYLLIDAFTDHALGGNPCAVLLDTDDLDAATMQAIAREMNLSETSFVRASQTCEFGVRYFTPAEEIPLAGHPTIATGYALWKAGRLKLNGSSTSVRFELIGGPIDVEVRGQNGVAKEVVMTQRKPVFMATYDPAAVMPCFGLTADDALSDVPIQTVSTGTPQIMIPVRDHDALRRIRLDIPRCLALRQRGDFFSMHLFSLGGVTEAGQTFARHFVVPPDNLEDAATGSATGGMGAYLWRYGLVDAPRFTAEQGHWMGRPSIIGVEVVGPREDIETVKIAGAAVSVITGTFTL